MNHLLALTKNSRLNLLRSLFVLGIFLSVLSIISGQDVNNLKLKNYRPVSIYKVPVTNVAKAKYPVIDMHTHVYARNEAEIEKWIKAMDECGIKKSIVFTGATGSRFDDLVKLYSKYSDRFELWCGFDYTGYDKPGYGPDAVKELARCVDAGARGAGELMFKGKREPSSPPGRTIMLPDDPRMDPLFEKCAELKIPSIFTSQKINGCTKKLIQQMTG